MKLGYLTLPGGSSNIFTGHLEALAALRLNAGKLRSHETSVRVAAILLEHMNSWGELRSYQVADDLYENVSRANDANNAGNVI